MSDQDTINEPTPRTEIIAYLLSGFVIVLTASRSPESYPVSFVLTGYTAAIGFVVALISPRSLTLLLSFVPAFAFVAVQYLSALWGTSVNDALTYAYLFSVLAMFSLMVGHSVDSGSLRGLFRVVAVVTVAVSIYGIYQYAYGFEQTQGTLTGPYRESLGISDSMTGNVLYILSYRRVFSTFMSPNVLAGYLACSMPFIGYMMLRTPGKAGRVFYAVCMALALSVLLLTRSAGGFMAFAVAVLTFVLVTAAVSAPARRRRILAGMVFGLVLLVVAGYAVYSTRTGGGLGLEKSVAERMNYWKGAAEIFLERPLTGNGAGSYRVMYMSHILPGGTETRYAHNVVLQTLAETGIIGLAALVWLFAAYFRRVARGIRGGGDGLLYAAFGACGAAFLVHNMTDFTFYLVSGSIPFWLGFGALASLTSSASGETGRGPFSSSVRFASLLFVIAFTLNFAMAQVARQRVDHAVMLMSEAGINSQAQARDVPPPPEAIELAKRAVSLKPYDDGMHDFLGNLYEGEAYKGGPKYAELAEAQYKKASELNPEYPYHYRDLGILYLKIEKKDLAKENFRKALSLYPNDPNLKQLLELSES